MPTMKAGIDAGADWYIAVEDARCDTVIFQLTKTTTKTKIKAICYLKLKLY